MQFQNQNVDIWEPMALELKPGSPMLFICHPILGCASVPFYQIVEGGMMGNKIFGITTLDSPLIRTITPRMKPDPQRARLEETTNTIPNMARSYLKVIQKKQAHGPYYLLGYSMGSKIFLEVARLLEAQGEKIALWSILDVESPADDFPETKDGTKSSLTYIEDLRGNIKKMLNDLNSTYGVNYSYNCTVPDSQLSQKDPVEVYHIMYKSIVRAKTNPRSEQMLRCTHILHVALLKYEIDNTTWMGGKPVKLNNTDIHCIITADSVDEHRRRMMPELPGNQPPFVPMTLETPMIKGWSVHMTSVEEGAKRPLTITFDELPGDHRSCIDPPAELLVNSINNAISKAFEKSKTM